MASKKPENNVENKKGKKSFLIVAIPILAALLIAAIILFFVFKKDPDITTEKLMNIVSDEIPSVFDVKNYSEANDPNGIMGKENQYISKSSWQDSLLSSHASEFAGTIEIFRNTNDAELREFKLNKSAETCASAITPDKYGDLAETSSNCKDYKIYREKTVVIRISSNFTENQATEYLSVLRDAINKFEIVEQDIPSAERISELRTQIESDVKEAAKDMEDSFKAALDDIMQTYEDRLNALLISLDEDNLNGIKEELNDIKNIPYFSNRLIEIQKKIKNIEDKIAQKKQQEQAAAQKAESEKLAKKNKKLGAGKYTTCTDIDEGTYDAVAVSGGGNFMVHSDSYLRNVNEILYANRAEYSKEYKNITLSCGDIVDIYSSLVIQFTAKR